MSSPIRNIPAAQRTVGLPHKATAEIFGSMTADASSTAIPQVCSADLLRDDLSGLGIAQYMLGRRIGQGGMGQVYEAKHTLLNKNFAIKFIRPEVHGQEATDRFLHEIHAVGRLNHVHLVNAVDAGQSNHVWYCVTELLNGHDLCDWIKLRGTMPIGAAAEVARQAAIGLFHAHQHGFIHRDIKPSNLFLENSGNVRILDFGIARQTNCTSGMTCSDRLLGTVDFMSPEQAANATSCTEQSDLYSLGACLAYLLTGEAPFPDREYPSLVNKLSAIASVTPSCMNDSRIVENERIWKALQQSLSKKSEGRFQTTQEFAEHLENIADPKLLSDWMKGDIKSKHQHQTTQRRKLYRPRSIAAALTLGVIGLGLTLNPSAKPSAETSNEPLAEQESTTTALTETPNATTLVSHNSSTNEEIKSPIVLGRINQPTQEKTIAHQAGSSGNARAIGVPVKLTPRKLNDQ